MVLQHADFENVELYAVKQWVKVTQEGRKPFGRTEVAGNHDSDADSGHEIPVEVGRATGAKDIQAVQAQGLDVDDDNNPAPENLPTAEDDVVNIVHEWGWDGFDRRRQEGFTNHEPQVNQFGQQALKQTSILSLFCLFFPMEWFKNVFLVKTNEAIQGQKVSIGEMYRWLGLWFYMALYQGFSCNKFWSNDKIDNFDGSPV